MTKATIRGLYLIGALLLGQTLWGQSYTLVNGTVTDSSKAVVSGASIELQNVNTLAKRTTVSNAAGVYVLQQVPPGKYQLSVAAQGFARQTITGLNLLINTPATVNIELTVAASAQSISVRATAEDINTTDASLGNAVGGIRSFGRVLPSVAGRAHRPGLRRA